MTALLEYENSLPYGSVNILVYSPEHERMLLTTVSILATPKLAIAKWKMSHGNIWYLRKFKLGL